MSSEDLNRRRRKIWFWGIVAICVLFILCLWFHSRSIPRDVDSRVREALTIGGFSSEPLSAVDGRTALLVGEIDESLDRNKLVDLVESVPGVRSVSDNLKMIQLGDARISLKSSATQITLQGVMPDSAAIEKTLGAAVRTFGAENVTNRLSVQDRLRQPGWLDALVVLIAELDSGGTIEVEADQAGVVMTGVVDSAEIQSNLSAKAAELFGDKAALTTRLTVKTPSLPLGQPNVAIAREDRQLVLKGELADQSAIDRLVAAAGQLAGVESIDNQLSVGTHLAAAEWLDGLAELIPALVDINDARVVVGGERFLIGGTLSAAEKRSVLLTKAKAAAGKLMFQDETVVAMPEQSARVSIMMSEGKLILSGNLPAPSDIDRVLVAVHNQFGDARLVNELRSSDSVSDPAWLDGVLQLFGYLTHVAQGGIEADDSGALIVGVVADQNQREIIDRRAEALLGDIPIDNRIKVKPASPAPVAEPPATLPEFPPLYYKHDSTDLVEASQRLLNEIVDLLKRYPDLRLEIGAHTDSAGDEVYNQDLSNRRAQDMARILTAAGIGADRLIPKGYGENQPISPNNIPRGRAMNRRIELKVLE